MEMERVASDWWERFCTDANTDERNRAGSIEQHKEFLSIIARERLSIEVVPAP